MQQDILKLIQGEILEEDISFSLAQLCKITKMPAETVLEMIDYGVIEPCRTSQKKLQFTGDSLNRLRCAQRLKMDLGVNTAGAALAVELLEELNRLRSRLQRLEEQLY